MGPFFYKNPILPEGFPFPYTYRFLDVQVGAPTNLTDGYVRWFILRTDE